MGASVKAIIYSPLVPTTYPLEGEGNDKPANNYTNLLRLLCL